MGQYDPIPNDSHDPPIPTYDEATAPTPTSATAFLGTAGFIHDAERQGLLGQGGSSRGPTAYQPPTVESVRSSMDLSDISGTSSARQSADGLRQEISQMEIDDSRTTDTAWKRISGLTSNMHLPFKQWLPSWSRAREMIPKLPEGFQINGILLIRAFALVLVLSIAYLVFFSGILRWRRRPGVTFDERDVRHHVQGAINETNIQEHLRHLTQWDHVAGTKGNFWLAKWIEAHMNDNALESVNLETFEVYLNYPKVDGRRVAIVSPPDKAWQAKLEEERIYPDREQTLNFYGLSASGNVTGPLVYANYGSKEDFDALKQWGVKVNGSIALVRYGGSQGDRGRKIKNAELAGAVGCIIYSDPNEDGASKGQAWPDGRYRPSDSIERGTVALTAFLAGDALTPGYASLPNENHRDKKENSPALHRIPSIPLAWRDAQVLLQSLKGHGQILENSPWMGGVPAIEWWTGDDTSPQVNLQNLQDEPERQPIYNVRGKIEGQEQSEKSIILGNHYDSWCFGAGPSSGTAVVLEIIRVFGTLISFGWRPRRTIEFVFWDAGEYNRIGSTEHVEARIQELKENGYAYINVDVAATGPNLRANASPLFSKALMRVLKKTNDPKTGYIMYDVWKNGNSKLGELKADSDYVAFQDFAGVSSIDLTFEGDPYPSHSCYANFDWMIRYGDPGFHYHKLIAQIVALLTLELADEPLLQFDLSAYATALEDYMQQLEAHVTDVNKTISDAKDKKLDFANLHSATQLFSTNAQNFHKWGDDWEAIYMNTGIREGDVATWQRWEWNNKIAQFETDLLDIDGGLPTRSQYKHIIFAPDRYSTNGYTFPGPRDALQDGDWALAQKQLDLAAEMIKIASQKLVE